MIERSMSRVGTPTDNPIIESINGWIKEELKHDFDFKKMLNHSQNSLKSTCITLITRGFRINLTTKLLFNLESNKGFENCFLCLLSIDKFT